MKKILISSIVLLFYLNFKSQTVISTCTAQESIITIYSKDAAKMAAAQVYSINSTYKDSITLDKIIYKKYLDALLAVYNATTLPCVDTIFQLGVHPNLRYFSANEIYIKADSSLSWTQNLKNNIIPCGNSPVDYLLNKYYLKKKTYLGGGLIVLSTDTGCNTKSLVNKFNTISGILASQYSSTIVNTQFDGTDIKDSITNNFVELTYLIQWGDCLSGCICKTTWRYRIYGNCTVEYLGRSGCSVKSLLTAIPINKNPLNDLKIFPNPAQNELKIEMENNLPVNLTLSNTFGEIILRIVNFDFTQVIDLSVLQSGVYLLKLETKTSNKTYKILKE